MGNGGGVGWVKGPTNVTPKPSGRGSLWVGLDWAANQGLPGRGGGVEGFV